MVISLVKFGTSENVGQFALGLAVTAPVFALMNLKLGSVQATDANQKFQFRDYLLVRFFTTILSIGIILVVLYLGEYQRQTTIVILLICISKSFDAISDILWGLFQFHERMEIIAKSQILRSENS